MAVKRWDEKMTIIKILKLAVQPGEGGRAIELNATTVLLSTVELIMNIHHSMCVSVHASGAIALSIRRQARDPVLHDSILFSHAF